MRIAAVVPLYGSRPGCVAGGWPQRACEGLAARAGVSVEVLATCAREERTWADFFSPGRDRVGAVGVHRFRVDYPRSPALADRLERAATAATVANPGAPADEPHGADPELERRWLEEHGPCSSSLVRQLERDASGYDAIVLFTCDAAVTANALGLARVAERSVLAPLATDERRLRLGVVRAAIAASRGLVLATPAERDWILADLRPSVPHATVPAPGAAAASPDDLAGIFLAIVERVAAGARDVRAVRHP